MSSSILDLQKAALILFKSVVPINTKDEFNYLDLLLEGIYIMPNARKYISKEIADYCILNFSNKVFKYNKTTLHNSFKDVAEKDVKDLLVAQLDHYFSVYMQTEETSSNLIDSSLVHVPVKSESNDDEPFIFNTTMVSLITKEELFNQVARMLSSGIALNDATQRHLLAIFKFYKNEIDVENIKNKEFLMRAYKELNIVPKKSEQLLRYLIYRLTNATLLINSQRDRQLIYSKINNYNSYDNEKLNNIIKEYVKENGVESIAKQFNRYRKLWIIFKHVGKDAAYIINRARKLSSKLNKPHNLMALDKINDKNIDLEEVKKQLEKVSIFKKFSLLNSIYNASSNNKMYFIRNGRIYSTVKEKTSKAGYKVKNAIFNSIKKDIGKNIKSKRFYIPDGIMYAVPTSEKNFVDNIPMFTRYRMNKNSIIGIYWTNTDTSRVDLDLHYNSKDIHVGWNTYNSNEKIVFTGDITNAPKPEGATEAFYIKENLKDDFAVIEISNFAGKPDTFELFIAGDPNKEIFDREKIINSKELAFKFTGLTITDQTQCLGIIDSQEDYRDFIFTNVSSGFNRTPVQGEHKNIMLNAMRSAAKNRLFLNDLIVKLGGEITLDKEKADYDLSINSLTKDSFDFLFKADV